MKCQRCENEATVHEVNIKGGKHVEKHLCEKCAREQGLSIAGAGPSVETLLESVISVVGPAAKPAGAKADNADKESDAPEQGAKRGALSPAACSACGRTFAQFRSTGVLGCPQCYAVFENQLGPLLSRAHEGGTHHVGKSPRSMSAGASDAPVGSGGREETSKGSRPGVNQQAAAEETERRLGRLRASLKEAVASEQYEKAAKIRDELHRLQSGGVAKDTGGSGAPGSSVGAAQPPSEPLRAKRKSQGGPDQPRNEGGGAGT